MNTTPIEKCSIGKDAEYDVKVAASKSWSEFEIYPNGNLIGTSPTGMKYEPVPRYAEMLREAAPDLLTAICDLLPYVESCVEWEQSDCPAKADLLRIKSAIARATGEKER